MNQQKIEVIQIVPATKNHIYACYANPEKQLALQENLHSVDYDTAEVLLYALCTDKRVRAIVLQNGSLTVAEPGKNCLFLRQGMGR